MQNEELGKKTNFHKKRHSEGSAGLSKVTIDIIEKQGTVMCIMLLGTSQH